jgi:hypothetical protein
MRCGTINGISSRDYFLDVKKRWALRREITGFLSRQCCIDIAQVFPSEICRNGFSDWKNVHRRFSRWAQSGVLKAVFAHLASDAYNEYAMIDSTIVRAHQHIAGAVKKKTRTRQSDEAKAV